MATPLPMKRHSWFFFKVGNSSGGFSPSTSSELTSGLSSLFHCPVIYLTHTCPPCFSNVEVGCQVLVEKSVLVCVINIDKSTEGLVPCSCAAA